MNENKLQPINPSAVQPTQNASVQTFNAHVDTVIGHAGSVQTNVFVGGGFQANTGIATAGLPPKICNDYYCLFVVNADAFGQNTFYIPKEQALQDTNTTIVKQLCLMESQEIETIRSYPAIVAVPNASCGNPSVSQVVQYGFINGIRVESAAIHFSFMHIQNIPQSTLLEYAKELGIGKASAFNELDRPHWAIKNANLISTLAGKGIQLITFSNQNI